VPYVLGVDPHHLRVVPASEVAIPKRKPGSGRAPRLERYADDAEALSPLGVADQVRKWTRVAWAQGTKGRLQAAFYRQRVRIVKDSKNRTVSDEGAWLLLERRSRETKAYLCWGLDDRSLEELVRLAHCRWTVEQFHRDAKQELALEDFEGRTWKGWHHHMTMVLLAHAFVVKLRAELGGAAPLAPFAQVVRALVHEAGTQLLIRDHRFTRRKAAAVARTMIRGFTEWG
jgi:SRSO17 transposase